MSKEEKFVKVFYDDKVGGFKVDNGGNPGIYFDFMVPRSAISNLIGRLLTIIDAAIVSKEQNEAIKSMINQCIWDSWLKDQCSDSYDILRMVEGRGGNMHVADIIKK